MRDISKPKVLWAVKVYANTEDLDPAEVAYLKAADEATATKIVREELGADMRPGMYLVTIRVRSLPTDVTFWLADSPFEASCMTPTIRSSRRRGRQEDLTIAGKKR